MPGVSSFQRSLKVGHYSGEVPLCNRHNFGCLVTF